MEKVVGIRLSVVGSRDSINTLKQVETELEAIGKRLQEIADVGSQIDDTIRKLRDLGRAAREAGRDQSTNNTAADAQKQYNQQIDEGKKSLAELRREINRLKGSGQDYQDLIKRAAELKNTQQQTNKEIRDAAREFERIGAAAGSYRDLNAQLVIARNQFRALGQAQREGGDGRALLQNIQDLDRQLKQIDKDMGIYVRNVGNYQSAWNGIAGITVQLGALLGIATGLDDIIQSNAEISDSFADVQKTTGLAADEAVRLGEALSARDTRTSLADQLGIAEIGGRLGIAREELEAFVTAIDTANVALGDRFGGSAETVTEALAGTRNILTNFRTEGGLTDELLRIANALNVLETQGPASAESINNFVTRIGGAAVPLNASAESILGLATTLDELNITAERGSTSVTRLLTELAQAPEDFAGLVVGSGLVGSFEEFERLVQEDIVSALGLVSKAAAESSEENTEFAAILEELGITGAGAIETFGLLGGAYDTLQERISTASEALDSQQSILDEFQTRNQTLGAAIDKLRNSFINLTVQGNLQGFFAAGIEAITDLVDELGRLARFLSENRVLLVALGVALASFRLQRVIRQVQAMRKAFIAWKVATEGATVAQKLLNTALRANPIGFVVSAVALLTGALVTAYRNSEPFREFVDGLWQGFRNLVVTLEEVNPLFRFIVAPIRAVIDLIRRGPVVIDDWIDSFNEFVARSIQNFNIVADRARIFGLRIRQAFTFSSSGSERITQRIQELQQSIEQSNNNIEKIEALFDDRRAAREAERLRKKREAENAAVDAVTVSQRKQTEETETESKKRKKITEEEARALEKIAEDRLRAQRKIIELENAAIEDRFDRQIAQATTAAQTEINSLVGDPDQIARQTELIKARLDEQQREIEQAREDAQNKAIDQVRKFQEEVAKAQEAFGIGAAETNLQLAQKAFEIDEAEIERDLTAQLTALQDNFNKRLISEQEFEKKRDELQSAAQQRRFELTQEQARSEIQLNALLLDERLSQLDAQFAREIEQIQNRGEERRQAIQDALEVGAITQDEAEVQEQEAEEDTTAAEANKLRELEQAKADLQQEFALMALQREQEVADARVKIKEEEQEKIAAAEKKGREQALALLGTVEGVTTSFFENGVDNFRGFLNETLGMALDALEQQATVSIAEALVRNLGTSGPIIGPVLAGIATGLIKAAIGRVRASLQTLEGGGNIPQPGYHQYNGIPQQSGQIQGPSHNAGGVQYGAYEVEGGEFALRNGNVIHIINKRSTEAFKPQLMKLARMQHAGFSAQKAMFASQINSFQDWGNRFFQEGGSIFDNVDLETSALAAPAIEFLNLGGNNTEQMQLIMEQNQALFALVTAVDSKAESINGRVDRLRVINDPEEIINIGGDQVETSNNLEL